MKFSLDWLGDFAPELRSAGAPAVADAANEIGLEIGTVEPADGDTVLDADITPNRPDAMHHRGFARDVSAALGVSFDGARRLDVPPESGETTASRASVSIEVPDRCRRFAIRVVRGIAPAPSVPRWRRRMDALGLKTIDAAVDASNISLWGLGQPLHAFDLDRIEGGLVVRRARRGEKLRCLDGVERTLDAEDVVVADGRGALSLAGVIGGTESAITPGVTRNVLLEAAWWDPVSIRRTARRHGLHTDASHRYERGADVEAIPEGLALAARLIREAAGGEVLAGIVDEYPGRFEARVVTLRESKLVALSGVPGLSLDRAAEVLARLGFGVERRGPAIAATVPSWRPDVAIEEDLIEEVIRIHGYSRIPFALPPSERLAPLYLPAERGGPEPIRATEDRVADAAREAGFFEAMNFPFTAAGTSEAFGNFLGKAEFRRDPLEVENPLDATRPKLRRLLLPGLLESVSANHRAGRPSIALFEIGRAWDRPALPGADPGETESRHFAAVLAGFAPDARPVRVVDLLDAKGMLHRIALAATGTEPAFPSLPGGALEVRVRGAACGVLARLPETLRAGLDLPADVVVAEIDLGAWAAIDRTAVFRELSRFPAADVDVTVTADAAASWRSVEEAVSRARLENLESVVLLKLYADPERAGVRHLTVRLTFRAPDRTLSREEVHRERDRLIDSLKAEFGVKA